MVRVTVLVVVLTAVREPLDGEVRTTRGAVTRVRVKERLGDDVVVGRLGLMLLALDDGLMGRRTVGVLGLA